MIMYYCDVCGNEVAEKDHITLRRKGVLHEVEVHRVGRGWHKGTLCTRCIAKVIAVEQDDNNAARVCDNCGERVEPFALSDALTIWRHEASRETSCGQLDAAVNGSRRV